MSYEVETVSVDGGATALGAAGPFTLVVDRPADAGGAGLGFGGGQLLNLAVAGCISNDLFREAARAGVVLDRVRITANSQYTGEPAVSTPIEYEVELEGDADEEALRALAGHVDTIAEIPNSIPKRDRGPPDGGASKGAPLSRMVERPTRTTTESVRRPEILRRPMISAARPGLYGRNVGATGRRP